ncbi:Acyl-coa synthetase short-chain family member, partial [Globisporangium polare]
MWKRAALQARTRAVVAPRNASAHGGGGGQIRRKHHQAKSYMEQYQRSLQSPQEFWAEAADEIEWFKPYDRVLDMSGKPMPKWFAGGEMNTCYNALDVHVNNGRGDAVAIHYDSPLTGTKKSVTYKELHEQGT